jgi:hypothetical protein
MTDDYSTVAFTRAFGHRSVSEGTEEAASGISRSLKAKGRRALSKSTVSLQRTRDVQYSMWSTEPRTAFLLW